MEWLVTIHSVWRWAVLIAAIGALALAIASYLGSREWDGLSDRSTLIFTIVVDIQVLVGVLVWLFSDRGNGDAFLTWIHPGLMLVAAGLAHAGRAISQRVEGSKAKGQRATLFFAGSLVLMLIGIPLASWPL